MKLSILSMKWLIRLSYPSSFSEKNKKRLSKTRKRQDSWKEKAMGSVCYKEICAFRCWNLWTMDARFKLMQSINTFRSRTYLKHLSNVCLFSWISVFWVVLSSVWTICTPSLSISMGCFASSFPYRSLLFTSFIFLLCSACPKTVLRSEYERDLDI